MTNSLKRALIGVATLTLMPSLAREATACSCVPSGPPCQNYFRADAVFVGIAQSISTVDDRTNLPYRHRLVSFALERAFRGVQGTSVDVITGMGGGDCGYNFSIGERYLVYAYRTKSDRIQVGICSRTRPIAEAVADLNFIEGLPAVSPGGRVFGTISHWERNLATGEPRDYGGAPSIRVVLRGSNVVKETMTDAIGQYEVAGVPAGHYEVQAMPPTPPFSAIPPSEVELRDPRACMTADFWLHFDGRISGIVLGADGGIASGLALQAMPVESIGSTTPVDVLTAQADETGHFEFTDVPPGRYVLGVGLQPTMDPKVVYPTTFYPGTSNLAEATVITVGEGNQQQLEAFRVPLPRTRRVLSGVVVWPDGRPAGDAFVSLWDGTTTWRQVGVGIKTEADGRFSFVVHDGLSYRADATFTLPNEPTVRQAHGSVGPFVVSEDLAPLRVVLELPSSR